MVFAVYTLGLFLFFEGNISFLQVFLDMQQKENQEKQFRKMFEIP